MKKVLFQSIAMLVGTIIGAGILGLPYVVAQAGFWVGIANIVVIGFIVMLLYLYLGETILRTKGIHQLTGYAEKYLGGYGKWIMAGAMVFGTYGALIAYLIGEGQALSVIFGGEPLLYTLGFFVVVSVIIYSGLKKVAEAEMYMLPVIIFIVILVAVLSFKFIDAANLNNGFPIANIFIP